MHSFINENPGYRERQIQYAVNTHTHTHTNFFYEWYLVMARSVQEMQSM